MDNGDFFPLTKPTRPKMHQELEVVAINEYNNQECDELECGQKNE